MCREEEHGQLEFAALDHLENPDFHVESVRIIKLYNRIKDVLASMDCPKSFTLKDLIKPASDRTELFLSAILNFGLHRLGLIMIFCGSCWGFIWSFYYFNYIRIFLFNWFYIIFELLLCIKLRNSLLRLSRPCDRRRNDLWLLSCWSLYENTLSISLWNCSLMALLMKWHYLLVAFVCLIISVIFELLLYVNWHSKKKLSFAIDALSEKWFVIVEFYIKMLSIALWDCSFNSFINEMKLSTIIGFVRLIDSIIFGLLLYINLQ